MRVGILGINHKLADLKLRESFAQTCQRRFGAGSSAHGDSHYFVLLSTCNRTEIYFSSEHLAETHTYILNILRQEVTDEFDQKLYTYFGSECFFHLCRVTTGLDSAIVGETEIQGQVKNAYEYATNYITLPEPLHYLFQKAFKVGKQVRSQLPMQRGFPDLEHAILNTGAQIFANPFDAKVLFVGASDINRKILAFFKLKNFKNLTLCNRSPVAARELSLTHHLHVLNWQDIINWHFYDWVIFGTKANGYLIDAQQMSQFNRFDRKLIIDLSVPRNVKPDVGSLEGVTLLNIDEIIQNLSVRHHQMAHIISEAEKLICNYTSRQIGVRRSAEERRSQMLEEADRTVVLLH